MKDIEMKCKRSLLQEGVPEELIQQWYEAVYVNPDASVFDGLFRDYMWAISDSDIMDLLTVYGEDGSEAALHAMIKYFTKLLGIKRELKTVEVNCVDSVACLVGVEERRLVELDLAVNTKNYRAFDGAALMIAMAHEMWHVCQVERMGRWLDEHYGAEFDFRSEMDRELLYYLNHMCVIELEESERFYAGQIIEREAYRMTDFMATRIKMFSPKVHAKAKQSIRQAEAVLVG